MAVDLVAALVGWLTEETGGRVVEAVLRRVRGDAQDGALRQVVAAAVDDTVASAALGPQEASHLRSVLREHDQVPGDIQVRTGSELRGALAAWTAVLDKPAFGGSGYLRALGISSEALAAGLADRIEAGIRDNARTGGPLSALAEWLWREDTTSRMQEIEAALRAAQKTPPPDLDALFVPAYQLPDKARPSFLLRSDFEVVPFGGRERETADFLTWAAGDEPVGVRLCLGPGGQGKTRFAQHLVTQFGRSGWVAGRLRPRYQDEPLTRLLQVPADLFVVLDYAETQPARVQRIWDLLMQPRPGGIRTRVLLMARSAGTWWDELQDRAPDPLAALLYNAVYELPPLFGQPDDRLSAFQDAITAFCAASGYEDPGIAPPPDLAKARYARALTLHMTALATLLDHQQGWPAGEDAARVDPASRVLAHERNYWADAAGAVRLPHAGRRLLDAVITAATCCGAATRDEAVGLLSGLPDLAGEHHRVLGQYADWAHQLHPGDGWLNPLEPDLLGEHFIAQTLPGQDDLTMGLARAAKSPDQMWQLLRYTAEAAERYPIMSEVLIRILTAGRDELWLVGAMTAAYLPDPRTLTGPLRATLSTVADKSFLWAAAREIPSSHRVADLKIDAAREALDRYRSAPQRDLAAETELTEHLSAGLYYDGQHEEVVDLQRQLIKAYSKLAKQDPRRYTAKLGYAMINYGNQLLAPDEARRAGDLASQVITMAASVPSEERPELLMRAFSLRSMALKSLRKPEDAVRAAERAVQEARAAARSGSEEARAWLPMEIMNLANRRSELGEHQQALEIIRQSVDLMREREQATPDPLSPNMAEVLINYAQCLHDCGIIPEAREAVAEAVTRLCRLVRTHSKFVPKAELAADLWRTYLRSSDISNEQVRADYEQLIGLLGELSETSPAMGMERAEVMSEYGARLTRAGDLPRARHWKAQAARARNSASRGDPADPR